MWSSGGWHGLGLGLAVGMVAAAAVAHYCLAPPVIAHDSIIGFETWRSMQEGAGWNQIVAPDPTDLSRTTSGFLAWWSPGQYLPAGWLMRCGLPLGTAVLLTAFVGSCSLAFGLWRLCLALGTTRRAAELAALAAVVTWHTLYAFGMFNGGEVALIAVWPWIVLGAWRLRGRPAVQTWVLPLLLVAGSYAKLSFSLYAAGLLAFLWWEAARERRWAWRPLVREGARLALAGAIYLALWSWLHLSRGDTPMRAAGATASLGSLLGFAFSAPWFAALGVGSLAGRWFATQGLAGDASWDTVRLPLLCGGAVGGASYIYLLCHRERLMRLAGTVSLIAVLLLVALKVRGGTISLEDRHLRPAGVLLLAVCACWATGPRAWPRRCAATALVLAMAFGLGAAVQRIGNLRRSAVRADNRISVLDVDRSSLRLLEQVDRPGRIIYLQNMNLVPAVQHAHVLLPDEAAHPAAWYAAHPIFGRAPSLVLVLAGRDAADGIDAAVRARFRDYRESDWRQIGRGTWDFWIADAPPTGR